MLSWVGLIYLWEMPEGLSLVRCFGSVCIYCLHCGRVWFEYCLSGVVQPSEQWISSSGCREVGEKGGTVWEKFTVSVSFPLLLAADQRASGRWMRSSCFQHGVRCSDGGNWSRSVSALFSNTNTAMCVHGRQMSEENECGMELFCFPAFQRGKRKKPRPVEYNAFSPTLIPSHVVTTGDFSSPLTMISCYSFCLRGINTAHGSWENFFLKTEIVTYPENTNSYGSAPELRFLYKKRFLLQTKEVRGWTCVSPA